MSHEQRHTHTLLVRPAFAEQPVSPVHVAVHAGEDHDRLFRPDRGEQPTDRPVGRLDVRIITRQFAPRLGRSRLRHIRPQSHRPPFHPRRRRLIRRMRRLKAHDAEPAFRFPVSDFRHPFRRPPANDIALVSSQVHRLRQPRAVQPRIIEQETAFKSFPEAEPAPPLRRHHRPGLRLADQRRGRIARGEVPFAKVRRRIAAFIQLMRNRPRADRQRVEVVAHPILRRRHAGQQGRPRERSERMRRHCLRLVHPLRRESVQVGRPRIRIARISARLRPPLRGHDP